MGEVGAIYSLDPGEDQDGRYSTERENPGWGLLNLSSNTAGG